MLDHVGTSTLVWLGYMLESLNATWSLSIGRYPHKSTKHTKLQLHCRSQVTCRFPPKTCYEFSILTVSHIFTSHILKHFGVAICLAGSLPPGRCVSLRYRNAVAGPASRCEVQQHWLRRRSKSPDLGKYSWPGRSHGSHMVPISFPFMVLFMENSPGIMRKSSKKIGYESLKTWNRTIYASADLCSCTLINTCIDYWPLGVVCHPNSQRVSKSFLPRLNQTRFRSWWNWRHLRSDLVSILPQNALLKVEGNVCRNDVPLGIPWESNIWI